MAPAQMATLAPAPSASGPAQVTEHNNASREAVPPAPAAAAPPATAAQGHRREPQRDLIAEALREPERDLIAEAIRATAPPESAPTHAPPPVPHVHSGWIIQVGAFDIEREARDRLNAVQAKIGQKLKHASPFTEAIVTGDKTLYRARFAGMEKDEAEAICRQLKRNDIVCMTIKN
jgi:D-alanyl-D-alanine carboxypeptidase